MRKKRKSWVKGQRAWPIELRDWLVNIGVGIADL
jgi:hypothetical protein